MSHYIPTNMINEFYAPYPGQPKTYFMVCTVKLTIPERMQLHDSQCQLNNPTEDQNRTTIKFPQGTIELGTDDTLKSRNVVPTFFERVTTYGLGDTRWYKIHCEKYAPNGETIKSTTRITMINPL